MKNDKYRGYIVEDDRDGDSDNYHRNVIKRPDGTVVREGVYDYCLMDVINSLPNLTPVNLVKVTFNWRPASVIPSSDCPIICMTTNRKLMTIKAVDNESEWERHFVDKYHIKYLAYQHELIAE